MKKIAIVYLLGLLFSFYTSIHAQCTFSSPYGSATINNTTPGYSVTITTCQWGGEVAVLNFNVTGAFSFSSSNPGDYLTLTNSTNSVIAFGTTPLNAAIPTTGTYYLHVAASAPPACGIQNTCRTTEVFVPFPPCAGVPQTGTPFANPSVICPNSSATITLPGVSTGSGLFFQWLSSTTGSMGLYGTVPGASAPIFTTPITATSTTWYKAVVACINSGQSATSTPIAIDIAGTTTNTVPYFEGFENLIVDNQLPNCSWKASNMPQTCQTYVSFASNNRVPRTGTKFASFYYLPASASYFYTNGIYLKAGVTYSASVWFTTEDNTFTNWSDLSLLIGPNQSTVGLQSVASTGGTAASPNYKSLSNTFTIASDGIYYLATRAISNGFCCAQYLTVDDIEITAPCSVNTPTVSLSASQNTICQGESLTLSASGADTYLWSNGSTATSIQVSPALSTSYFVVGTHSASACSASLQQMIDVYPSPLVYLVSSTLAICAGDQLNLNAVGALSYTWNTGFVGQQQLVSPTITTTYSVLGANAWCEGTAAVTVTVNALPLVNAVSTNSGMVCADEPLTLIGSGANSYTWSSISSLYVGNPVTVFLSENTLFTLTGINTNGCMNTATLSQAVDLCVGLGSFQQEESGVLLYPNPGTGEYYLQFENAVDREILVSDVFGQSLFFFSSSDEKLELNLNQLNKGVYFLTVITKGKRTTRKVIKE